MTAIRSRTGSSGWSSSEAPILRGATTVGARRAKRTRLGPPYATRVFETLSLWGVAATSVRLRPANRANRTGARPVQRAMRPSLLLAAVLVASIGLAASADARDTSETAIRARLRSTDPKEIAWGLHDAIHGRVHGLDDLVRAVVGRHRSGVLDRLALDAILELDIPVEPALVKRGEADLDVERRLLFASRDPLAYQDVLRRVLAGHPRDDHAWTAACTMLASLRDPDLARHLLSILQLEAHVGVRTPGETSRHASSRTFLGRGHACHQVEDAIQGWPPEAYWTLTMVAGDGHLLVSRGRTPIYAYRLEIVVGDFVCKSTSSRWSRRFDAPGFLADLLAADAAALRGLLSEYETVEYTGPESFERGVAAVRTRLLRQWIALVGACVAHGILEPRAVLALPPRITYRVDDHRAKKEPAIRELPKAPAFD